MTFIIPGRLAAACRKIPERAAWLARLPETLRDLEERWSLTFVTPFDGDQASCAWVAPVKLALGPSAVLKLGMPHMEGEQEIEGLRFWNGDPTVRLLEADDDLGAMLLERCEPGTALRMLPEPEQDLVIARLLRRLWRSPVAPHPFRPLSAMIEHWSDETLAQAKHWRDASLVREGLRVFKELPHSAPAHVLLATDPHAGNVLRARREPWLVIDPKPFVGDPAYDATQHLRNCDLRLRSGPGRNNPPLRGSAWRGSRSRSLVDVRPRRRRAARRVERRCVDEPRASNGPLMVKKLASLIFLIDSHVIGLGAFGHGLRHLHAAIDQFPIEPDMHSMIYVVWYFVSGSMLAFGVTLTWVWWRLRIEDVLASPGPPAAT